MGFLVYGVNFGVIASEIPEPTLLRNNFSLTVNSADHEKCFFGLLTRMRGSVKIIAQLVFKMWINVLYTLLNGGFVLFSDPIVRGKKRCRIAISDFVTISSLCDLVRVKMAAGKAQIGKLAPDFTAKAVMPDGQFHDLKLSDYRGRVVVHRRNTDTSVGQNKWGCNCHSCINCGWSHTLFLPLVQENMWSFSSTRWTSPLCAPLK